MSKPDKVTVAITSKTSSFPEWDDGPWEIGAGDNLDLSYINHDDVGLVLKFGRRVTNAYVLLEGDEVSAEVWWFPEDIGDSSKAMKFGRFPFQSGSEPWGAGIGLVPGYCAMRLVGRILTIEDVVYE